MSELVIYIIPIIIILILLVNQPMPLLFITLASLIICCITVVFVNRNYQDKFLYFTFVGMIVGVVLIYAYFQFSARFYNEGAMFDYICIGTFVLVVSYLIYDLILKIGDYKEKIGIYDNTLKTYPNDIKSLNNKGTVLINLEKYSEAIECFDKAIEIDPSAAAVWHNKGVSLEKLRKHKEAIRYYDKALKIDPNFELARKMGHIIIEN